MPACGCRSPKPCAHSTGCLSVARRALPTRRLQTSWRCCHARHDALVFADARGGSRLPAQRLRAAGRSASAREVQMRGRRTRFPPGAAFVNEQLRRCASLSVAPLRHAHGATIALRRATLEVSAGSRSAPTWPTPRPRQRAAALGMRSARARCRRRVVAERNLAALWRTNRAGTARFAPYSWQRHDVSDVPGALGTAALALARARSTRLLVLAAAALRVLLAHRAACVFEVPASAPWLIRCATRSIRRGSRSGRRTGRLARRGVALGPGPRCPRRDHLMSEAETTELIAAARATLPRCTGITSRAAP